MPLKLMYITNNEIIAKIAERAGVDWIFVDLEYIGKEKRQKNMNTVKSHHTIDDVKNMRKYVEKAELLVRINPINSESENEINNVVDAGADIIMLPYFKTINEIKSFLKYVDSRCKTCLLLETPESVSILDQIILLKHIDYIHIGLNDLHIGYKMKFMFELLSNGTVETLCKKISTSDIIFGFGGIAKLDEGTLPSNYIIPEHYRLGSSLVILSRSFYDTDSVNSIHDITKIFTTEIERIRQYELRIKEYTDEDYMYNKNLLIKKVNEILKR